jgi:hypothetical protein
MWKFNPRGKQNKNNKYCLYINIAVFNLKNYNSKINK